MRLHRFYVNAPITSETFDVTDKDLIHQWKSVFRYNVGSQVIAFDGSGTDYLCLISSSRNSGATLAVVLKMPGGEKPKRDLWLCLGLIKKDNFELAVEKAVEIGATHIIPVLCERSEKKKLNMERLHKIIIETAEQSGRGDIPTIYNIIELPQLLDGNLLPNRAIFMNLEGVGIDTVKNDDPKELAVFIGPEGGWGDLEVKNFALHNIPAISLGTQVLRAETAAIAISSLLLL